MKTYNEDPVLAEMHAIKDSLSAEFGHDVDALFAHLKAVETAMRSKTLEAASLPASEGRASVNQPARRKGKVVRRPGKLATRMVAGR